MYEKCNVLWFKRLIFFLIVIVFYYLFFRFKCNIVYFIFLNSNLVVKLGILVIR